MSERKPDRNCGQCIHDGRSLGCAAKAKGSGMGDIVYQLAGPHDCPHWAPSDAHRTAEALEVIAGCLVERSITDEEARIPPEVQAFRCNCRSVVECMSTDDLTRCGTCGQLWKRAETAPDEWNEIDDGDLT